MIFQTSIGSFEPVNIVPNTSYRAIFRDSNNQLYATNFPFFAIINFWVGSPDGTIQITVPINAGSFKDVTQLIQNYVCVCNSDAVPNNIPIKNDINFNHFLDETTVQTLIESFDNLPS